MKAKRSAGHTDTWNYEPTFLDSRAAVLRAEAADTLKTLLTLMRYTPKGTE